MTASVRSKKDLVSGKRARGEALYSFLSEELSRRRNQYVGFPNSRSLQARPRTGMVLLILVLSGFLVVFSGAHLVPMLLSDHSCGSSSLKSVNPIGQHSIALIDQMGSEHPNPAFVSTVSSVARAAGYLFDYYPPNTPTIDFFLNLPIRDYSVIVLRTHGTGLVVTDPAAIVTSEYYSDSQHVSDQLTDRVTSVYVNGTRLFALQPGFVSDAMCGRFSGTLVLAMFCAGAQLVSLAKAFVDKGAGYYVGWDKVVTVSHTDAAFESLVKLLLQGNPVDGSINEVMATLGPDPVYGARLTSYSQSSFHPEGTPPHSEGAPLWEQYWYIISAGTAAAIFGLTKVRNAPAKRHGF